MAWDEQIHWSESLHSMWEDSFENYPDALDDPWIASWFESAWMTSGLSDDQRESLQAQFVLYLHDMYDIDFEEVWDWEAFREAYSET